MLYQHPLFCSVFLTLSKNTFPKEADSRKGREQFIYRILQTTNKDQLSLSFSRKNSIFQIIMKSTPVICGLDLGSWSAKVCAFSGDKFQILTNQANFRETPSLVGYTPTERLIGQAALIKIKKNYSNTIRAPQRLLGLENHKHLLDEQLIYSPLKYKCGEDLLFTVSGKHGEIEVSSEQVLISLIGKVKHIISSHNLQLSLAYIAVPTFTKQEERYTLKKCAEIALGKPVRIIDDWIALGSQYAYTRMKELKTLEEMRNVIFMDFGYSKVSLSLVQFTRFEGRLLDWENLPFTGCKNMDSNLAEFYNQNFQHKFQQSIIQTPKAFVKLIDAIQRQRTILSANSESHLNLQYLIGENDLVYNMTREEFQNLVIPVLADIAASLASFQSRNCSVPIHSIELMGGASRIPCIQSISSKIFGIEPSKTLNQSEAIAVGSVIYGSLERKLLNMQFSFDSLSLRQIAVKWKNNKKQQLFSAKSKVPSQQSINFGNEGTVQLGIFVLQGVLETQMGKISFKTPNKVTFILDENKILTVRALKSLQICDLHRKPEKKWQIIKQKEQEMLKLDLRMNMIYEMKNDFQSKFYWCKNKYEELSQFANEAQNSGLAQQIKFAQLWVEEEHHKHGGGSEKDLQAFQSKINEINELKKACEVLEGRKKSIDDIKIRYDRLVQEISEGLQLNLTQAGQQRLVEIMNWGQQAYQSMENHNWKSNELTLENIEEASIMIQSLIGK